MMAALLGKDCATLTVGGINFRSDTQKIDGIGAELVKLDQTVMGQDSLNFTAGMKDGNDITHTLVMQSGSGANLAKLYGMKGSAVPLVCTVGSVTQSGNVMVYKVNPPLDVAGLVIITATYVKTGDWTYTSA
jgi:hypothetical protein